jgi:ATP-dependent Clp protease, protease subunit
MAEELKFDKDWVQPYFEYGIDVVNRRVFLSGDITEDSIATVTKGLYLMESFSDMEPCEIFISSLGGDIHECLALYDIIKTLNCPVHTFAFGKCMSAAPLILAAGHPGQRWCAPHTSFLHHDWGDIVEGTGAQIKSNIKHNEEINKMWLERLVECTNKDYAWWYDRGKRNSDFYFYAEDALEWGLADNVWIQK